MNIDGKNRMDLEPGALPSLIYEVQPPAPTAAAVGNLGSLVSIDSHRRGQLSAALAGFVALLFRCGIAMECDGIRQAIVASTPAFAMAAFGSALQQRHSVHFLCLG